MVFRVLGHRVKPGFGPKPKPLSRWGWQQETMSGFPGFWCSGVWVGGFGVWDENGFSRMWFWMKMDVDECGSLDKRKVFDENG